jgi:hypothetical protein
MDVRALRQCGLDERMCGAKKGSGAEIPVEYGCQRATEADRADASGHRRK